MTATINRPRVLIPVAPGTNRDQELAAAFTLAGAEPHRVPLAQLRYGEVRLADFQLLALPGGFSYGDALGAGRLIGLDLSSWFGDQLREARDREMPIIGICNGFQALVHAGLLPGEGDAAALTANANGRFECRWVHLAPQSTGSVWTTDLARPLWCPVAHGEGRFVAGDLERLEANNQVAFRYCDAEGAPAGEAYPLNPNGSARDVAGVVDPSGLVLGMMPHPEDHVLWRHSLRFTRRRSGDGPADHGLCLSLFEAGVSAVA